MEEVIGQAPRSPVDRGEAGFPRYQVRSRHHPTHHGRRQDGNANGANCSLQYKAWMTAFAGVASNLEQLFPVDSTLGGHRQWTFFECRRSVA